MAVPRSIDLSDIARNDYETARGFRYLVAGIGIALAILLIMDETPWSPLYTDISPDRTYNLISFVPVLALCLWFVLVTSPGATRLTITSDGITLDYAGGRHLKFHWNDPRLRLTIWRYDTSGGRLPRRVVTDSIITLIPLRNPVSPATADLILTEAGARGLRVQETRIGVLGPPRIRFRVHQRDGPVES